MSPRICMATWIDQNNPFDLAYSQSGVAAPINPLAQSQNPAFLTAFNPQYSVGGSVGLNGNNTAYTAGVFDSLFTSVPTKFLYTHSDFGTVYNTTNSTQTNQYSLAFSPINIYGVYTGLGVGINIPTNQPNIYTMQIQGGLGYSMFRDEDGDILAIGLDHQYYTNNVVTQMTRLGLSMGFVQNAILAHGSVTVWNLQTNNIQENIGVTLQTDKRIVFVLDVANNQSQGVFLNGGMALQLEKVNLGYGIGKTSPYSQSPNIYTQSVLLQITL
jgi:hypothetical protein